MFPVMYEVIMLIIPKNFLLDVFLKEALTEFSTSNNTLVSFFCSKNYVIFNHLGKKFYSFVSFVLLTNKKNFSFFIKILPTTGAIHKEV